MTSEIERQIPQHDSGLQLNVLRLLPTPVLVLSPSKAAVFGNNAAAKLLGVVQAGKFYGQSLVDLGIKLSVTSPWSSVLQKCRSTLQPLSQEDSKTEEEEPVHEITCTIRSGKGTQEELHFRILFTVQVITPSRDPHYILSFERDQGHQVNPLSPNADLPKSSIGVNGERRSSDVSTVSSGSRDLSLIKKSIFDSCGIPAYIISADEKFYLTSMLTFL
jgi:hypothetical protein